MDGVPVFTASIFGVKCLIGYHGILYSHTLISQQILWILVFYQQLYSELSHKRHPLYSEHLFQCHTFTEVYLKMLRWSVTSNIYQLFLLSILSHTIPVSSLLDIMAIIQLVLAILACYSIQRVVEDIVVFFTLHVHLMIVYTVLFSCVYNVCVGGNNSR